MLWTLVLWSSTKDTESSPGMEHEALTPNNGRPVQLGLAEEGHCAAWLVLGDTGDPAIWGQDTS